MLPNLDVWLNFVRTFMARATTTLPFILSTIEFPSTLVSVSIIADT